MVTIWTQQASGAEEIARRFFDGVKQLFQEVRESVTIADRIATEFNSSSNFVNHVNQIVEPFLRYNDATNGKAMFEERYVAFNAGQAQEKAQGFLDKSQRTLADQGRNVVSAAESLVASTVVEVSRGVRLTSIDQFIACEPEYRTKIYTGRESIHLFPEEQAAIDYEKRIETLNEPANRQRVLSPEVVICMGDMGKLKAFVEACVYELITIGEMVDEATGNRRTELFLDLTGIGKSRLPLSDSQHVAISDPHYATVGAINQRNRLYLNALQNFVLKVTEKRGVASQLIANLVGELQAQGVAMGHIENPFTLSIRDVNMAIEMKVGAKDHRERRKALEDFIKVVKQDFEADPSQRVRDLATVMHLVLKEEISRLENLMSGTSVGR
jgi:hypothetical protein